MTQHATFAYLGVLLLGCDGPRQDPVTTTVMGTIASVNAQMVRTESSGRGCRSRHNGSDPQVCEEYFSIVYELRAAGHGNATFEGYLDPDTFEMTSDPSGNRIAFRQWDRQWIVAYVGQGQLTIGDSAIGSAATVDWAAVPSLADHIVANWNNWPDAVGELQRLGNHAAIARLAEIATRTLDTDEIHAWNVLFRQLPAFHHQAIKQQLRQAVIAPASRLERLARVVGWDPHLGEPPDDANRFGHRNPIEPLVDLTDPDLLPGIIGHAKALAAADNFEYGVFATFLRHLIRVDAQVAANIACPILRGTTTPPGDAREAALLAVAAGNVPCREPLARILDDNPCALELTCSTAPYRLCGRDELAAAVRRLIAKPLGEALELNDAQIALAGLHDAPAKVRLAVGRLNYAVDIPSDYDKRAGESFGSDDPYPRSSTRSEFEQRARLDACDDLNKTVLLGHPLEPLNFEVSDTKRTIRPVP